MPNKKKRYYVKQYGAIWSFPKEGYELFLQDGCKHDYIWNLNDTKYRGRRIKNIPDCFKPICVTDFTNEDFKEELKYFEETGKQSGKIIQIENVQRI